MKSLFRTLSAFSLLTAFLAGCEVPPAPITEQADDDAPDSSLVFSTDSVLVNRESGYQVELPPEWQILFWKEGNQGDANVVKQSITAAQELLGSEPGERQFVDLVAQKQLDQSEEADLSLMVTVVPRNGLSLQDYLAAASEQVQRIEQTTLNSIGFDDELRADGQPVGVLSFTKSEMTHRQLILLNQSADQIILFSFVSPTSKAQGMTQSIKPIMDRLQIQ